jgi:ligand-binding sensor domain-containing protein
VLPLALCGSNVSAAFARNEIDPGAHSERTVLQVHVDPRIIQIPVVDGKGIRFTRLSKEDGLSQTKVTQIVQDNLGFMWFGSQYGLNRYDGYKFKVFAHEAGQSNSLSGVYIYALFKGRSGFLWIACDEFLDKFDPVTETFTHYRIVTRDSQRGTGPILQISQDHTGMLWLITTEGLYRFDPDTGQSIRYTHDPKDPFSLSDSSIKCTYEDKEGNFWVGTSAGVDRFDRSTNRVTLHIPLYEPDLMSVYEDSTRVLWIIESSGEKLAVFDRKTNTLTRYSFRGTPS